MKFSSRKWIGVSAVAALAASAGGFGLVQAASGTGTGNVYNAIVPCRIVDTRPATLVGPRATPIGAGETVTINALGTNGECTAIAADAQGVQIQLTATNATAQSFLAAYPADATSRPNVSQLNTRSGPDVSNSTIVNLSPTGQFKLYNHAGTSDIVIDILGVFVPGTGTPGPVGPVGPAGPAGPAGNSTIVPVTDLTGEWTARAEDVAGIEMTGDGIKSGPFADGGACDVADAGLGYARLDYKGMNGQPLSSLNNLVFHARYTADNDTSGVGAPTFRVFFEGTGDGGIANRLTFSANTQFNQPVNYDIGQGEMHEWVVTSGTVRYNNDGGTDGSDELPWADYMALYGDAEITNINVLSGCSNGQNLTTLIRRAEVNGTTYVFGDN